MTDQEIIRRLRLITSVKRGHRGAMSVKAIAAQTGLAVCTVYDARNGCLTQRAREVLSEVLTDVVESIA